MKEAEAVRLGVEDWRRVFGESISPRQYRRILKRVQDAGGGVDPDRDPLRAYLRKPEVSAPGAIGDLAALIAGMPPQDSWSRHDRARVWGWAFEYYEAAIERGEPERSARHRIQAQLLRTAPVLSLSGEGMRRNWREKLETWRANGRQFGALVGGDIGRPRVRLPKEDVDALLARGMVAPEGSPTWALREALQAGELTDVTARRVETAVETGRIPPAVGRELTMIPELRKVYIGPRNARLNGPSITRNWNGRFSRDRYEIDDLTLPIWWVVRDGDWWRFTQGQVLAVIDSVSKCLLDFLLIGDRSFDGLQVRRILTRACKRFGHPKELLLENGIFRAKVITGGNALPDGSEIESGFERCGIRVRHALPGNAKAKLIEGVFGKSQRQMELIPGFVGGDQMHVRWERVQRQKALVEARKLHPADAGFLNTDGMEEWLNKVVDRYNHDPQHRRNGGKSPHDLWVERQPPDDPPANLPPEALRLLTTEIHCVTIREEGARIEVGRRRYCYQSRETGERVGQKVLVHFNIEDPSDAVITDMNRKHPVVVPLVPEADPSAGGVDFKRALELTRGHQKAIEERFSDLKIRIPEFRKAIVSKEVREFYEDVQRQRADIAEDRECAKERKKALLRGFRHMEGGAALADAAAQDPEYADALQRIADLSRKDPRP